MSGPVRRARLIAIALFVFACGRSAFHPDASPTPSPSPTAEPQFGDGHDGDRMFVGNSTPNLCLRLVDGSGLRATVSAAGITGGTRVLVLQVQDSLGVPPGPAAPISALASAGRWEFRRVVETSGSTLTFDAPLAIHYRTAASGASAEICTMPEYAAVMVSASANVLAAAWDGTSGGLVGFFAHSLSIDSAGAIVAGARGFRGGTVHGTTGGQDEIKELDTAGDVAHYGGFGEGVDATWWDGVGRGAAANGGGGGGCFNAGGGGGGNGGAGGFGGSQATPAPANAATAGRGGAPLPFTPRERLAFGGGGGSGQQDLSSQSAGAGGAGGGVVVVFAGSLSGGGKIASTGAFGGKSQPASPPPDGAGGGGAGGTILLVTTASSFTGAILANGGDGGDVGGNGVQYGVGGGGAGGRILGEGFSPAPFAVTSGGSPGRTSTSSTHDATRGTAGTMSFP